MITLTKYNVNTMRVRLSENLIPLRSSINKVNKWGGSQKCKNLHSFKLICSSQKRLFKIQTNQGMNRVLSLNYCWLRNSNYVKFTKECLMCMEKYIKCL